MIAYFEEEAVRSYTDYLALVESGEVENVPTCISNKVLQDEKDAKLSDLIKKVRADEQQYKVNFKYADGDTLKRKMVDIGQKMI